jgi:hypothetical protein
MPMRRDIKFALFAQERPDVLSENSLRALP